MADRIHNPTVVVGLLWHSIASGNLGVMALTLSQIAIVRNAAELAGVVVQIKVFGWRLDGAVSAPSSCEGIEYFGVDARSLLSPHSQVREQLARCQIVLDVGEGDSFSDIYGLKRLLYMSISKYIAGGGGRKLVLSPQTIGPFGTGISRGLAALGIRRASRVFARDPLSKGWLDKNRCSDKSDEAIDMAFRLPFQKATAERTHARIGLNVSGLLYSGGYGGKNSLGLTVDYAALTHRLIEWGLALPNTELWLVPHVLSRDIAEEDDFEVSKQLAAKYPKLRIAGPFHDPSEAKSFMSGLDFFAGGRMHACIGAFSAGVPVVPIAYSRKFNGLFQSLEYGVLADCRKLTTEAAFEVVRDAYSERKHHAEAVVRGVRIANEKLLRYEQFLIGALREVNGYA